MKTGTAIKRHFMIMWDMFKFHLSGIMFILKYKMKDMLYFKRINAKKAHAIYIDYRDEKLKDIYRSIRHNAKIGYTSTNIMVHDKETAYQFEIILQRDNYYVKVKENVGKTSTYGYELHISWSQKDMNELNKLL